jgi:hypothetical protein
MYNIIKAYLYIPIRSIKDFSQHLFVYEIEVRREREIRYDCMYHQDMV